MILYHGSLRPVSTFRRPQGTEEIGLHLGTLAQAKERMRLVFVDLEEEGKTDNLQPTIYETKVMLRNPLGMLDQGFWEGTEILLQLKEFKRFPRQELDNLTADIKNFNIDNAVLVTDRVRSYLESKGYDGIVYKNDWETPGGKSARSYIVFDPDKQVRVLAAYPVQMVHRRVQLSPDTRIKKRVKYGRKKCCMSGINSDSTGLGVVK